MTSSNRSSLYTHVTARIIAELEEGRVPWVQPWTSATCDIGLPRNAGTGRPYSGINILILWGAVIERGFAGQGWLTYRQAEALGGHVGKGEQGTTVCYADRFTPKAEAERTLSGGEPARQVAFLKRFTVFNTDQCEDLPSRLFGNTEPIPERNLVPTAERVIMATGAVVRVGGDRAFYAPLDDIVQLPSQQLYHHPIDWYRTAFHELGHWTGHASRLDRDQTGRFGDSVYAHEELVAEMASAFVCASLSIQPTVRRADYIGSWLDALREDSHAIFRAASQASRAADWILREPAP
jgi:antirestriction protein ArdC